MQDKQKGNWRAIKTLANLSQPVIAPRKEKPKKKAGGDK